MATTTNFGWTTPDDTDLVKDGAAAIRTLGSSIDTSLVDLKGGTTGQVLTKASGTDLDFNFTTPAANPLTTTGDIIYSSSGSTAARLGIGTASQILAVNSGATAPEWVTLNTGAYTLLASGSHSGTNLSLTSISGAYTDLYLILDAIDVSATATLRIRYNNDTNANRHQSSNDTAGEVGFDKTFGNFSGTFNGTGSTNQAMFYIPNYASTSSWKFGWAQSFGVSYLSTSNGWYSNAKVFYNQSTAITQLDIFESTAGPGSFSCSYKLYGVK